eukprot:759547-Hanusia_phi.AAC.3
MKEYRNKHTINVCKGASNQSENQEKSCRYVMNTEPFGLIAIRRICFEAESDSSNALVSPCNCKGTQRYVHTNCLKRWQRTALSQPNSKRAVICSVCNSIYSMPPPSTIYSFDDSSFAGGSLPSWLSTLSRNIFVASVEKNVDMNCLMVFRGISGWAPRQLDGEIRRGGWKIADVRLDQIFDANSRNSLWEALDSSPDTMLAYPVRKMWISH